MFYKIPQDIIFVYPYTIFNMEQFLKLPQIRISILEKIVSERRKKIQSNSKSSTTRLQPALINGQKPYYKFLNDIRSNCTCSHLRCDCKNNSHYHNGKKYPFLLRRQKTSQILTEVKRQHSQGQSQKIRKNKQLRKNNNLSKQALTELIYRDKLNKLYEKIEKKVLKKLTQSKKSNIEKECFKKQVIEYMMKKYNKKSKNPSIIDELTIREHDQLVKQIQRFVINNQKIPQQKQSIDNLNEQQIKDGKKRKNLQKSRTEASLNKNQGKQRKKGKKKKNSIRLSKKSSKQQLLSMILKNDKKQNEDFINLILNYDIKIFRQTINKIQQILQEYSDEQIVKNNIIETVKSLQAKIKASQLDYQSKQCKLKCIQKILRFKMDQNVDIQYMGDQDEQFEDNRLTSTLLKSRKTIKSIKKSLKSQKSVRSFVAEDEINMISAFSIKSQSQISLGQVLEINKNLSQEDFEDQKENFPNYEIKINLPSSRLLRENINQKIQQNQPKTQKIVLQHNLQYLRTKTQKHKTKKHYSQEIEFDLKNLLETKKEQNKENEKESFKVSSSAFKKQYSMEMKKLRQNLILEENKIKQFMQHNKQTVVKGISRLKDENLQMLIIETTDSLLTKKKKIRKLKQLASSGAIKVDLISEILAYINLYQVQSNLILRRKKFETQSFSHQNQTSPEFSVETLIDKGRLFEDFKFISLNKNYCYGQIEEEQAFNKQFNYGISSISGFKQYTINQEGKDFNVNQKFLSEPFRYEADSQLIQKQMGQQGHFQQINLLEYERQIKRKGIKKKSTQIGKKTRKLTQQNEQQGSSNKKNRFLLTQNTLIL